MKHTAWGENKTLKAWHRDARCHPSISYSALFHRVKKQGLSVQQAMTKPCQRGANLLPHPQASVIDGPTGKRYLFHTVWGDLTFAQIHAMTHRGVSRPSLYQRLFYLGWSVEEAVITGPLPPGGSRR